MDQFTLFGQVTALHILQYMLNSYGEIDEVDIEENTVKMMGPYDPAETLSRHIDQPKKGQEFTRSLGQTIYDAMMVSRGITLLSKQLFLTKIFERGADNLPSSIHGRASKISSAERTKNRKERQPAQVKGFTLRGYIIYTSYRHLHHKSTTKRLIP